MKAYPMPTLLVALLLAPVLAPVAGAQSGGQLYTASRQQLDVTKVLIAQENAWNNGDLDAYLKHFKDAADTEAILNGPVRGLGNIRSAFHTSFPSRDAMGQLEQSEIEVRELGPGYALATGKYHLIRTRKNGGDAQGNFTEVFEKTEAGWQLIFSENT